MKSKLVAKMNVNLQTVLAATSVALLTACAPGTPNATGRVLNFHEKLIIVPPETSSSSVSAQAIISIGSLFLESQLAPVTVANTQLQASDLSINGADVYVSYNAVDGSTAVKKGAIEHVRPYICDNPLTLALEFCLSPLGTLDIPTADIFASYTDGTNVYAVGSTLDETYAPHYGRLYKIGLNTSTKDPSSIAATAILPSYAGTDVVVRGSKVIATSGTTPSALTTNGMPEIGGLSYFNLADLSYIKTFPLYDARAVSFNAADSTVYVSRAKVDASNASAVIKYNADGSGSAGTPAVIGGNTVPESKSDLVVGSNLILATSGDGGFRVICKDTNAVITSVPAVTVTGIPALRTVTNSIAAVPGYIFTANGEGGVHVYSFQRRFLGASLCGGVNIGYVGRLSLGASATYVNAELSANSVHTMTVTNLLGLNLISTRFLIVASGNKGVSMINLSAITLDLLSIDDFN